MSDCNIPGFSIYADENVPDIEIETLEGTKIIPHSHRCGHSRLRTDFEKVRIISEGWFGVLFKCREKRTNELYTLKKYKIDLEKGVPSYVIQEKNFLSMLLHDGIIKCHGAAVSPSLDSNYIILDYCPVSLLDLLEKDPKIKCLIEEKSVIKHIMKQIFEGLEFIHRTLIIHRNIYDGNIRFTNSGKLKIAGFHTACYAKKEEKTPTFTEVSFKAPEVLLNSKKYGPPVDMWSAGCIFANMLLKKPLFEGKCETDVIQSINCVLGKPSEQLWPGFDELIKTFDNKNVFLDDFIYDQLGLLLEKEPLSYQILVRDLLIYNPNNRRTAQECLQSTYFVEDPADTEENEAKLEVIIGMAVKMIEL